MIETVLFPVDFSPYSITMAGFVKRAAVMLRASVSLLHVFDPISHNGFEGVERPISEIAEDRLGVARDRLHNFLRAEFPVAEFPRLLFSGNAAAGITQCAQEGPFGLIVMPTHAGRFRRMFLGSTTEKVLNKVDCPVLTTQHADVTVPRPLEHRIWACAVSLKADSERVLRQASEAASAVGAKLILFHALDSQQPKSPDRLRRQDTEQIPSETTARRRLEELESTVGCEAEVIVSAGETDQILLEGVRKYSADTLITGRGSGLGVPGKMSRLTYVLIRDSPCPVLSV
jgi:nucleotide-binding universal stress UspA family protein